VIQRDVEDPRPIFIPGRPDLYFNLPKALDHYKRLRADREDTFQVFGIFEGLPWRGEYEAAVQFLSTAEGQRIRRREPDLPAILDDHAALRRLPKGSLGQAYCDFMEGEELTARGLAQIYADYRSLRLFRDDQTEWYVHRFNDTHDLIHVLTSFGRDVFGEACVQAFIYPQHPAPGHLLLAYVGAWRLKRSIPVKAPLLAAVREAQRLGKGVKRLSEQAITELLPLPLEEARSRLRIGRPRLYAEVHRAWRAAGIDPFTLAPLADPARLELENVGS
jgi:ubiquinone biosynthesis protein COQ4